ncbi:MAG: asparaginase [Gemmatimonadota bacterium]|nr:asparaginase [Gemmatimonadota bacterium]
MDNIVVRTWRGEVIEGVFRAHIAVVNTEGRLLCSVGDPSYTTYWRSSSKPLQALPLIESGAADEYHFTEEEIAVTCASHSGEDFHTDAVGSILHKAGLSEDDLQCGAHEIDRSLHRRELAPEQPPQRIHSNCSGKHSGMLTTSKKMGWPTVTYRDPEHPLQRLNRQNLAELSAYPSEDIRIGIDGCGVPVFSMPIQNMAHAFSKLAKPDGLSDERAQALSRLRDAMMTYPHMIAGSRRFDSDLMREADGTVVCKGGAAALHCLGLPDQGIGLAIKIEDMDVSIIPAIAMAVLRQLDGLTEEVASKLDGYASFPSVKNTRDEVVGKMEMTLQLDKVS